MKSYKKLIIALLATSMISWCDIALCENNDDETDSIDLNSDNVPALNTGAIPFLDKEEAVIPSSDASFGPRIAVCHLTTLKNDPKPSASTPGGDAPAGATGLPIPPLPKDPAGGKWKKGYDDSRFKHNWTHGDPNKYFPDHNGYYYLDITATGTTLIGTVQVTKRLVTPGGGGVTPPDPTTNGIGYWLFFSPDLNSQDRKRTFLGCLNEHNYAELVWKGAIVGHHYRFRVANRYNSGLTDFATFRSE